MARILLAGGTLVLAVAMMRAARPDLAAESYSAH